VLRHATLLVLLLASMSPAQTLYKYRGPDGEWIYTDRPPGEGRAEEVRPLAGAVKSARVQISTDSGGETIVFTAENPLHVPVEVALRFSRLEGFEYPDPDRDLGWMLAPGSRRQLLELRKLGNGTVPAADYTFDYRFGDPAAVHRPDAPYRVPFAVSTQYPVTQAYPDLVTHTTADSRYAVDIAMPVGTDVFAARDGIVFDVSADHFKSGTDPVRDGPAANVVQILHDDGTYAVYAHLNWNSIRVRPGDRVIRGQYIADSGNTGFSSGPHLHFVVLRNAGMQTVSVPIAFQGADTGSVVPATGALLTAY
jgi:murein DD-endopeptidase MepM/ murein hydrolase activator NlpD